MNNVAADSNTLLRAKTQLQEVHRDMEKRDPRGSDTGSLARMLVHMDNIAKSVSASSEDHVNASKRLQDFANTLERMAMQQSPKPEADSPLRAVASLMRAAGAQLSDARNPPSWAGGTAPTS